MTHKNEPATKQDVSILRSEMKDTATELRSEIKDTAFELRSEMKDMEERMIDHMRASEDRIMRHFDVVAEDMFEKLNGANADQISAHGNKLDEHHQRLERLEHLQGIAA